MLQKRRGLAGSRWTPTTTCHPAVSWLTGEGGGCVLCTKPNNYNNILQEYSDALLNCRDVSFIHGPVDKVNNVFLTFFRVEITKIPANSNGALDMRRGSHKKVGHPNKCFPCLLFKNVLPWSVLFKSAVMLLVILWSFLFCVQKEGQEEDDGPLNLSIRSESADSVSGGVGSENRTTPTSRSSSDYYACE